MCEAAKQVGPHTWECALAKEAILGQQLLIEHTKSGAESVPAMML